MRVRAQRHHDHVGPVIEFTRRFHADCRRDLHVACMQRFRYPPTRRDPHFMRRILPERLGKRLPVAIAIVANCGDSHRRMGLPGGRFLQRKVDRVDTVEHLLHIALEIVTRHLRVLARVRGQDIGASEQLLVHPLPECTVARPLVDEPHALREQHRIAASAAFQKQQQRRR